LKLARLVVVKRNNQKFKKDIPADFVNIKLVPTCSSALRKLPQVKFLTPIVALYIATFGLYTINQVQPLMSLKRFQHTIRVAKLAIQIGRQISPLLGLKAYIAAMYHDISKEMSDAQIKKLAPK
jgi:HD-GYP domain-containing protein (c-di-GMP phosphodiesterase class II)